MDVYRTPDERFENLPGYPFEPHYLTVDGLRMHYLDEGHGDPILLLHGEPDWSYLYRKMIPPLATAFRVIAPDYLGFGRSDKPTDQNWYSFDRHTESIKRVVENLDLRGVTVVVQDWGGPIGLRAATEMQDRFARLVVLNTGLFSPGAGWPTEGFLRWRNFAERVGLDMEVGRVMQMSSATELDEATLAAYEAPWPTRESKAGVAAFPLLVPIKADDPGAEEMARVREDLRRWDVPALVLFSDQDPVFQPAVGERFARLLPGAHGVMETIAGASHMLQEDAGEEIAGRILDWVGAGAAG
ncbi:MAG: alpha/beta fold hydrolase [Chloroflexi bacterium]|nr:MAG: alpha/beta fold hydrolase [Chloroflexota bacterium]TMD51705.1 MAG: alpha/beta fold hydrolase [Chloroflexota bacterium]